MKAAFAEASKQAAAESAKRQRLESASEVALRKQSRTQFSGLPPKDAIDLARQAFPGLLTAPGAVALRAGQHADKYLNDFTALLNGAAPGGRTALVSSARPLLARTPVSRISGIPQLRS